MKHLPVIRLQKGFTLIEILIVIFIAGFMAAIAAPSFLSWYQRYQLNSAVNDVRGALQTAQRAAIRESATCSVTINTGNNPVTIDPSCDFSYSLTLPKSVAVSLSGSSTITYGFKGNTNNPNTITFSNPGVNNDQCLVISMPLGMIREGCS